MRIDIVVLNVLLFAVLNNQNAVDTHYCDEEKLIITKEDEDEDEEE